MLSSIGRAAVKRTVTRGPISTNQFRRVGSIQDNASCQHRSLIFLQRSYATATKVAATPRSKTAARAKSETKTATKKATKEAVEQSAKPVKQQVANEPAVKKVKILSAKQEEKKKTLEARLNLRTLKATALSEPAVLPDHPWKLFMHQEMGKMPGLVSSRLPEISVKYKSLSPSELESLNHLAVQNKAQNNAKYKEWVESHTPEQIYQANKARLALRKLLPKKRMTPIQDPRLPKQPMTAWLHFTQDRWASGDFKGMNITDVPALFTKEWENLTPDERQVYEDRHIASAEQYHKEYEEAFGREHRSRRSARSHVDE